MGLASAGDAADGGERGWGRTCARTRERGMGLVSAGGVARGERGGRGITRLTRFDSRPGINLCLR